MDETEITEGAAEEMPAMDAPEATEGMPAAEEASEEAAA